MKHREWLARFCRWSGVAVIALVLIAFTPLINAIARALQPHSDIRSVDAIVVLGADTNPDGTLDNSSLVRFVTGTVLQRKGFAPVIVFSGSHTEAATRAELARTLGVPRSAIIVETRAHTTGQEAQFIAEHLRDRSARRLLLVTNSAHLTRAAALFEARGFTVSMVPADSVSASAAAPGDRLRLLDVLIQEFAARVYYRLSGRL